VNKRIAKNMSDPESRAFWLMIEESARMVRVPTTKRTPWKYEIKEAEAKRKGSASRQPRKRR
jgi:hypothetical protein